MIYKEKYPIVLIHLGDSDYLKYTISQAKQTNQAASVVLIGDRSNSHYEAISYYDLGQFQEGEKRLYGVYKHLNEHPYSYEFFCMKRWFVLLDWMKHVNIDSCFYMDSDVLLYATIEEEKDRWSAFDLAYTHISGHTIFINSQEALQNFCDFIIDQYTNHLNELISDFMFIHTIHKDRGISDMYMFSKYRGLNSQKIGNLQESKTSVFDGFIGYNEGYNSFMGLKDISFKDGFPYATTKEGEVIKFNSLHLQGHIKYLLIESYVSQKLGIRFTVKILFIQALLMPYIMPLRAFVIKILKLRKKSNIL